MSVFCLYPPPTLTNHATAELTNSISSMARYDFKASLCHLSCAETHPRLRTCLDHSYHHPLLGGYPSNHPGSSQPLGPLCASPQPPSANRLLVGSLLHPVQVHILPGLHISGFRLLALVSTNPVPCFPLRPSGPLPRSYKILEPEIRERTC